MGRDIRGQPYDTAAGVMQPSMTMFFSADLDDSSSQWNPLGKTPYGAPTGGGAPASTALAKSPANR